MFSQNAYKLMLFLQNLKAKMVKGIIHFILVP